ncbi:VOC family protein [Sorangium sp. So ce1389]|uniref:VOC family protein n=1 Tax=Sorangium sp. So ce1389 TaxID=3133336 RepID=UPI003F63F7B6
MSATKTSDAPCTSTPPSRLHHYNFVCQDPERTREFYEGLLGLQLAAFWCEVEPSNLNDGNVIVMGHSFYALSDGSMVAFMHYADPELRAKLAAPESPEIIHIALKVTEKVQSDTAKKLRAAGHKVMEIDHGFVKSIYFKDPDGLTIEYAVDPDNADEIYSEQKGGVADANMKRYLSGDYTKTNRWMPEKAQHFEFR